MRSSKRIQKLVNLARWMSWGVMGTLLLSVGSAYFPFSMVQEAHRRLAEQQQEIEKARQAPGQLRALQQRLTTLQRELAFLERGVSDREYIPTMLKQIEQTAREREMQVVAVRPQNQTQPNSSTGDNQQKNNPKPYDEQMIEISLTGGFWNLVSFLKQLDVYPKILAVQTLQVQSKTASTIGAQSPELEVKMTVKAFIFRTPRPSSSTPQNPNSSMGG